MHCNKVLESQLYDFVCYVHMVVSMSAKGSNVRNEPHSAVPAVSTGVTVTVAWFTEVHFISRTVCITCRASGRQQTCV